MSEGSTGRVAGDRIRLTGVRAIGYHGVLPEERRDGQEFVADVVLHLDTREAAATDRLDRTVDYGGLATGVAQILAGDPVDLIETVAERIAALALSEPAVFGVDVVVHKPGAPITVPFGDVTVEVHRDRNHPAVVPVPGLASSTAHPTPPTPPAHLAPPTAVAAQVVPSAQAMPTPTPPALPEHAPTTPVADLGPVDHLDEPPTEPVDVVLGLGSNLGSSQETLRCAIDELSGVDGLRVTGIAPLARTGAVGGPEQPDFLNTVVLATCTLSPRALLRACQGIEQAHGRVRDERWGPRTLDVDLICYGSVLAVTDDLELPHPRAHSRAFVLEPWAQIDPDAMLPGLGGGPVALLATTAPDRDGIRWLALDWWTRPETS